MMKKKDGFHDYWKIGTNIISYINSFFKLEIINSENLGKEIVFNFDYEMKLLYITIDNHIERDKGIGKSDSKFQQYVQSLLLLNIISLKKPIDAPIKVKDILSQRYILNAYDISTMIESFKIYLKNKPIIRNWSTENILNNSNYVIKWKNEAKAINSLYVDNFTEENKYDEKWWVITELRNDKEILSSINKIFFECYENNVWTNLVIEKLYKKIYKATEKIKNVNIDYK